MMVFVIEMAFRVAILSGRNLAVGELHYLKAITQQVLGGDKKKGPCPD